MRGEGAYGTAEAVPFRCRWGGIQLTRLVGKEPKPRVAMLAAIFLGAGMLSPKVVAIRAAPASQSPSYNRDVFPILRDNCMACHSSAVKMGGLVMESYDMLMKGGKDGQVIVPGKAAESRMILMLEGKVKPQMPFGGNPLPADQLSLLKAWIDSGAAGPAPGEAPVSAQPNIPNIKPEVPVVSPIGSLAFSPDGKMLAVGGYQEVELLDPASGGPSRALRKRCTSSTATRPTTSSARPAARWKCWPSLECPTAARWITCSSRRFAAIRARQSAKGWWRTFKMRRRGDSLPARRSRTARRWRISPGRS